MSDYDPPLPERNDWRAASEGRVRQLPALHDVDYRRAHAGVADGGQTGMRQTISYCNGDGVNMVGTVYVIDPVEVPVP